MKKNHNKDQVIAVITLSAIFGLFLFLKINPEQSDIAKLNKKVENKVLDVTENKVDKLIDEAMRTELSIEDIASKLVEEEVSEAVQSFTDKELKRAQSYTKKRWAPDNTINIAAWNHAKKIKIIGNSNPKLAVKKSASDNKTQIVSSSN